METIKNETEFPKLFRPDKRKASLNRFSIFMNNNNLSNLPSLKLENFDFNEDYNFNSNHLGLENERMMIEIIKSDEIDELLKDFILKNRVEYEHYNQAFTKTRYAAKDSRKEFFEKFNKFEEITRKGFIKNKTPSFEFIKACREQKIVPNPIGMIKRKGAVNQIKLNSQKIGDEYVNVLSKGVRWVNHIKEIDLSGNRLTSYGVFPLINSIKENQYLLNKLKILDLSYNKIGPDSVDKIIEYVKDDECDLQELNVEGNLLGNEPVKNLCENISKHLNYNLSLLNIGKNSLNDEIAKDIGGFVKSCHSLKVLILCWNYFKNIGASIIVNNMKRHPSLKIFDISWNCIGNNLTQEINEEDVIKSASKTSKNFNNFEIEEFRKTAKIISINKKEESINKNNKKIKQKMNTSKIVSPTMKGGLVTPFAKELGEYFKDPTIGLVHLDISHNNISYEDCNYLAQEIKMNHSILGIHVDGNEVSVDELGFLLPIQRVFSQKSQCANVQIYYKIGKENSLIRSNIENVKKIRAKNNCWICEGWREITFIFTPDFEVVNPESHFVKLHLSIDNWRPYDSYYSHGKYYAVRMCPPGEVTYFFTIDKNLIEKTTGENIINLKDGFLYQFDDEYLRDFNIVQMKNLYSGFTGTQEEIEKIKKDSNSSGISNSIDGKVSERPDNLIRVRNLQKVLVEYNNKVIDKNFFKMFNYSEPRPEKNVFQFTKPRTPWNFSKSIWAAYDYRLEGEQDNLVDQMFEFDYNWGGFAKEIAEDPEGMKEVKKYLKQIYKKLLEAYKFLSAYMGSSLMQISENTLTEFFNSCPGLLDQNYIMYFIFIQQRFIKSLDKEERSKYKNIPDNIIRHQFLILLVKVAKDKYIMKCKKPTITTLFDAIKYSFENHFLPTIDQYDIHNWRKERYYIEQIDNFIKAHLPILDGLYKTYARNKDPGKKEVWMVLDNLSDLTTRIVDSDFPLREVPIIYNLSMRWQVDEIHTDRAYNMQFPEFLEALCRIIDKYSPIPPNQDAVEWPKQRRDQQPLVTKLENITQVLLKNVNHPEFKLIKEKFVMPVKEKGIYEYDPNSAFYLKYFTQFPKMK